MHRSNESCAGCHAKIDPPGFALESYDVIGGYRVEAKVGIEEWRRHYNEIRPHSSLGYLTPLEFKTTQQISPPDGGHSPATPARADHDDERTTPRASLQ